MKTVISPYVSTGEVSPEDALWSLIQRQTKAVRQALKKRFLEEDMATKQQQEAITKSLAKAFEELHAGEAKPNARQLFRQ